jgi:hypothetical protein
LDDDIYYVIRELNTEATKMGMPALSPTEEEQLMNLIEYVKEHKL